MKVLLLSAYDIDSHRFWRKKLVNSLDSIEWQVLTLPARYFNWRIRGNPLSWALTEQTILSQQFDAVLATSMVDLATLKGLIPNLANTPSIVYFHENQFAYPLSAHQQFRIEPQVVTLYNGIAAERLIFNSEYNLTTYLSGIEKLLAKMPDCVPTDVVKHLTKKSQIIPVPIESPESQQHRSFSKPLTLVWNHRWEYDKGPDGLFAALTVLRKRKIDFKIHIIGQQFRKVPNIFLDLKDRFSNEIGEFGFIEHQQDYQRILSESDLVISTAIHEFQGLAILEAVASGCIPVVPDRLSYPEFFDQQYRYDSAPDNIDAETESLCDKIEFWLEQLQTGAPLAVPNISSLSWRNLGIQYEKLLNCYRPD